MELQSALENRKSIRSYLSKDVEPEKLTALIEAASLAPSWKILRLHVIMSFTLPKSWSRFALPSRNLTVKTVNRLRL